MTTSGTVQKSADAFRTISEVAEALNLPQHVLRFWETRFVQIKPLKRGGGRRFYRPDDVELLAAIRKLLYGEGYTIRGVQRILKEQGPRAVAALARQGRGPSDRSAALASTLPEEAGASEATTIDDGSQAAERSTASEPPRDDHERSRPGAVSDPVAAPLRAERGFDPTGRGPPVSTSEAMGRLRAVVAELADCRRVLNAAVEGQAG